ncbi:hypothetical protein LH935_28300 (plasmid) [Gordonia polyisoprenivorans]|uniref:antitoxin VbhA family protein n=1 Tax=Gordonia polyisoprenivorans TaxID=84595 RepID=UPI002234A6A3|nr:hypothetical protein LH935_28300 [Gordonia polyisoprenivorans]
MATTWTRTYPDLFTGLTDHQARNVSAAIDNNVLEGWEPTRDDIAILTARARGDISRDDLLREARGDITRDQLVSMALREATAST